MNILRMSSVVLALPLAACKIGNLEIAKQDADHLVATGVPLLIAMAALIGLFTITQLPSFIRGVRTFMIKRQRKA